MQQNCDKLLNDMVEARRGYGWDFAGAFRLAIGLAARQTGLPEELGKLLEASVVGRETKSFCGLPFPAVGIEGPAVAELAWSGFTPEGELRPSPFRANGLEGFYLSHPRPVWELIMDREEWYDERIPRVGKVKKELVAYGLWGLMSRHKPRWLEVATLAPNMYPDERATLGVIWMDGPNNYEFGGAMGVFSLFNRRSLSRLRGQVKVVADDLMWLDEKEEEF